LIENVYEKDKIVLLIDEYDKPLLDNVNNSEDIKIVKIIEKKLRRK
jgi:hypothetical protein